MRPAGVTRLLVALGVLLGSAAAVSSHPGPFPGEVGLLEAVNDLPRALGAPLEVVMELGTLGAGLLLLALVAVITAPRGLGPTVQVLVAVVLGFQLDNVVKELVERPRPATVLPELVTRAAADGFAFPSGHTTMAFALATSIAPLLPGRWRWLPIGLASGAAVARLYVGVHWPTDLLGGAALGTAIGTTACLAGAAVTRRTRPGAP